MNVAQAVTFFGFGYEYRADLSPGSSAFLSDLRGITAPAAISGAVRTHICEGPPEEEDIAAPRDRGEQLIVRVHRALQQAWRARATLDEGQLCEMLGASKASKRVEKALRALCREGLAQREGTTKRVRYWAEAGAPATPLTWRLFDPKALRNTAVST